MSHQIYYTSAPEGLRPGQSGFCTVATTEGIPRPLWDRLESVSGYRHEFSAGSGGSNPVAWAHWLLAIQGRELSVLSRISDSGLDYTQRTNAFAHHLALESSERAAAGPAWMLSRPGLMAGRWDGRVGAIPAAALPTGDVRPAACNAWQRLTGDAGWGGVLAEAGVKHPRRPVCILFSPGQDVLPLIAEAIALMPASKRWEVSFNTYFTGLPGNAVCAWRCCLAGTVAASDAARHAGGGLVIDLTRGRDLGSPPAGAWVEAARTGRAPTSAAAPIAVRPPALRRRSSRPSEVEPLDVVPIAPDDAPPTPAPKPLADLFNDEDDFPPVATAQVAGESRAVDRTWIDQQRRSRRALLIAVAVVALLFIAAGVWLRTSANRATADRPLESPATTEVADPDPPPKIVVVEPPPVVSISPPPDTRPKPPVKIDKPPVEPTPAAEPVKPVPPPQAINLPVDVTLPVTTGAALRAPAQTIVVPAELFDDLPGLAAFGIVFPGKGTEFVFREKELAGVLTAESAGPFRHQLLWRDDANRAVPVDVAMISLDRNGGGATVEIAWRLNALLKRPEVVALTRVLLQQGGFVVAGPQGNRPQPIRFRPLEPIEIDLDSPTASPLSLSQLPGAVCRLEKPPAGQWKAAWKPAAPDRGTATSEADVGHLAFERENSHGGAPATFTVSVGPRWSSVSSDFAAQKQAAAKAVADAAAAVERVNKEIEGLREAQRIATEPIETRIAEAQASLKLSDTELANRFTNRPAVRELIAGEKARLAEARKIWQAEIEKSTQKREPAESARVVAAETLAAFEGLKPVQIAVELPGKLRVATLRLKAP